MPNYAKNLANLPNICQICQIFAKFAKFAKFVTIFPKFRESAVVRLSDGSSLNMVSEVVHGKDLSPAVSMKMKIGALERAR
jgi:hypothetical protein